MEALNLPAGQRAILFFYLRLYSCVASVPHPESPSSSPTPLFPPQFDVLIVGGGAAGLYAALCISPDLQVGLVTKDTLSLSASDWAQGGIAAAIAPEDSPTLHVEDTLQAGAGLCDLEAVQLLVNQASSCVRSLVDMGVAFDRHGQALALTLEAAHSRRRVLHAADTTGRAVITTLTAQALARPNIHVFPQTLALDLWLDLTSQACRGMVLIYQQQVIWVKARAVIVATGGGGQVFAQTTNPELSTGDGVAMAWRAGATLRDLEFFQFHPTALTKPGAPRFLISEAVRGEGAHLVDAEGRRFAFDYHPAGELAPRDVVSRAIFMHLQQTASDPATEHVWLDLRPISAETIQRRFPNIVTVCQQWGVDVFHEPIPVAPAAHYWMGGIVTDLQSHTSIANLYAVGETASTGVHGANRLASNSLLECLVFGAQLAHLDLPPIADDSPSPVPVVPLAADYPIAISGDVADQLSQIDAMRQDLPRLIWQSAGICREQQSLDQAIAQVAIWRQQFADLPLSQSLMVLPVGQSFPLPLAEGKLRLWAETRNLLDIAYLILKSAALRTESRGGHYRLDWPKPESQWQVHTLIEGDQWRTSPPLSS